MNCKLQDQHFYLILAVGLTMSHSAGLVAAGRLPGLEQLQLLMELL